MMFRLRHVVALAIFTASCLVFACGSRADGPTPAAETKEQRDARMAWWREAKFGMFIHWGPYAVLAGEWKGQRISVAGKGPGRNYSEWIMYTGKIPVAEYAECAAKLNPTKFDADVWAATAEAAGMKYLVITSKHHDGFAMFPSQVSPYNIYDATPFKRDPLKELSEACAKRGIKFGVYYSQAQDWHHAGGGVWGGSGNERPMGKHWDSAQEGDFDNYLRTIAIPQVRELLTTYKPAIFWFDTPVAMTEQRSVMFLPLLALRPGLIVNNRLGKGFQGDTETPEQTIPAGGFPGRDWETCMTINDSWGYKSFDTNFKSKKTLLQNLVNIVSKGGNYLLNVGPTAEGVIPQPEVDRLKEIGAWLKVNSESIYGTQASPFEKLAWGRCTQKRNADGGTRLYLHVFDWPTDGRLAVPQLKDKTAVAAFLLSDPSSNRLPLAQEGDATIVTVPKTAPDSDDTVVVLDTKRP